MIGDLLVANLAWASLPLRIGIGVLFMMHGYPKLFLGRNRKETMDWLKSTGVPAFLGPFGGFIEFFGGLLLFVGLLTPIVAILAALWMLSTAVFQKAKLMKQYIGGYEIDATTFFASLSLVILGGGAASLDKLLGL